MNRLATLLLVPALALSACATSGHSGGFGQPLGGGWGRLGRSPQVREAAGGEDDDDFAGRARKGAAVGVAVVAVLGGAHCECDSWGHCYGEMNPTGALVGAVAGAALGGASALVPAEGPGDAAEDDGTARPAAVVRR